MTRVPARVRKALIRTGVAAAFVGLAVLGTGAAAAAAPPPAPATAMLKSDGSGIMLNGSNNDVNMFSLEFPNGGGTKVAYCIDIKNGAAPGVKHIEKDWSAANVESNLPKIQWILNNSYPKITAAVLFDAQHANVTGVPAADANKVAYVGTQAAIWHFSEANFNLTSASAYNDQIKKIYAWLLAKATDTPQPGAALTITPASLSGKTGEKIGPFTVTTNAGQIALAASNGAKVVDTNGNAIASLGTGGKFWVKSTNAATVTVTGTGQGTVPSGRVFLSENWTAEKRTQKIILAEEVKQPLEAKVTVNVAAQPSLPVTGASAMSIAGLGLMLLGGGGVLIMMSRRRRNQMAG